ALKAARRDRIALDDVPITWGKCATPHPKGLLHHGELVALEYQFKGGSKRSPFHGAIFRHAPGDNGKGKKKTKPQVLGIDPDTGAPILVSGRGSRPGFSTSRGLTG